MKELFLVGGSAAVGGWLLSKWGATIEAKIPAAIPPVVAHIALVAGSAVAVFAVARRVF